MDDRPNCIHDWPYLHKEKSIEELTESLWLTTLELEANRAMIQEHIRARDDRLNQLKHLLNDAINESNDALNKYQSLFQNKLFLQQQFHRRRSYNNQQTTTAQPHSGVSFLEDEHITYSGFCSSDCEESIFSSPFIENPVQLPPAPTKELPENGKFLEAVMKAGPLLQNLLLAGALPQWRHPPPPADIYQIPLPPLPSQDYLRNIESNCCQINKKRGFTEDSESSTETKYQKINLLID